MKDQITMTSGFNFEGYTIEEYYGFFSGETVLGTGFLSSYEAGFADFFGVNSALFSEKLRDAKNAAIEKLLDNISRTPANAIIGLDIDYNMFTGNLIGVIANGTAVKINKSGKTAEETLAAKLWVKNYSPMLPIRPYLITLRSDGNNKVNAVLDFRFYGDEKLSAINVDIIFTTLFEEEKKIINLSFINLKNDKTSYTSEAAAVSIDFNDIKLLKDAKIITNAYICDDKLNRSQYPHAAVLLDENDLTVLKKEFGNDAVVKFEENDNYWICVCGIENEQKASECKLCARTKHQNIESDFEILSSNLQSLNSAREIRNYLVDYNIEIKNERLSRFIEELDKTVEFERMYGNQKKDALKAIEKEWPSN